LFISFYYIGEFKGEKTIQKTGTKRDYLTMLIENLNSAPSTLAKCDDKELSWQQQQPILRFEIHRPASSNFGIPASLLHEAFGQFSDTFQSDQYELDANDFYFTAKFCRAMCKVYAGKKGEGARRDVANALISEYIKLELTPRKTYNGGTSETDGTLFALLGQTVWSVPILISEIKTEIGSGGCDPTIEGLAYYMWSVTKGLSAQGATYAREYSVMPLLLLSIVGPNVSFSFLANGATILMDPATPFFSCLFLPFDIPQMTKVARAFRAMKDCIENLTRYYHNLSFSAIKNPHFEQLSFPYCNSFTYDGSQILFEYERQIGNTLVFVANTITAHQSISQNTSIVVKFTRTYSKEAHQICFSYQASAPQLYSFGRLKGGWYVIIMESLEGFSSYNPACYYLNDSLKAIVGNLHSQDFVHGDLRGCNILVNPTSFPPRICLIDFDWSGKEDSTRYPAFMNHSDVDWADGASDFLPLKKAHDLHFLNSFVMI